MAGGLCPMLQLLGTCWILLCLNFLGCNGKLVEEEKRALLELRDSLNYPNGSALINEWVGEDYCAWAGIFCGSDPNNDSRVLDIFLTNKRQLGLGIWNPDANLLTRFTHLQSLYVSGNAIGNWIMPEALCKLHNLKELDLSFNPLNGDALPHFQVCSLTSLEQLYLSGVYPSSSLPLLRVCGLKNIRRLDLSNNNLMDDSMPHCLFNDLPYLESLDLSRNNLKNSNHILSGICKLRNLQVLNLQDNLIQGGLDPCFGGMSSLVSLDLSFNYFEGSVSSSICSNLTSLETLLLSDNRFDGLLLFSTFANLSNLESIDLSFNEFIVDTETPSWVPSFQLVSLNLRNTRLNQKYGHVIPTFLSKQHKLKSLSLSYNALQGNVPSWLLYNNTLLMLSLRGNHLYGGIPASFQFQASNLLMLDVSDNCLGRTLPTNLLELFPDLRYLNLSNNALEGILPSSFDHLSKLEVLDLSDNFLWGKLPPTLRQNNTSLAHLVISNNNFHGEVMPQFSNMSNLAYLHLQNDGFIGVLPDAMFNLPVLKVMDISGNYLSGNIPDYFPRFPHLAILLLARNRFHGTIPLSLCQMQKLHILDMSANLLSGVLPSCLVNIAAWIKESEVILHSFMWLSPSYTNYRVKVPLTTKGNTLSYEGIPLSQMTTLDLSMNRFTGEIPSQLGELAALHSLNLSHNILSSHIPESFRNLMKLESLDLSYNQLVGKIPPRLAQLDSLSTLNLAFNHLSGRIPFGNKFVTFAASSYRGNKKLCGLPLENDCVLPRPPQQHEEEEEEDKEGIGESDFFFFSCIAVAYVVGFWSVIAPLLLSRNWRRTYYAKVDTCIELCKEKLHLF
ncbi:receptor-like protein 56 isoform X2 [Nicotiana sylvestris]|uniref:Probable leucine-rich repeat receptor-like protein kinase At1g35710 isoform X2 n=1 Tax=Nicotiana sylvestris TaxID=4096 RepID=A0A1U7X4A5_NICSY|nr:PREDICTED: probable leucine-rich repeat receptor-like protein kinase At1g35710 isoform X2 [Nicotiana sylvestris]